VDKDISAIELSGGNTTSVTRIGQTVRRATGPWSPAVANLLTILQVKGVDGVPQYLGQDEQGRETLTYLPGEVAQYPLPSWLWTEQILIDAAQLLRRIHDASEPLIRAKDLVWRQPSHQPVEVICHNDFAPYNLVFSDGQLVGVIDFDMASPGPRIWDLAYLAYRLVPFCEDAGRHAPRHDHRLARLDSLISAYGWAYSQPNVFRTIADRLIELADWTETQAAETNRDELSHDAAMYRRDADRMMKID